MTYVTTHTKSYAAATNDTIFPSTRNRESLAVPGTSFLVQEDDKR